MYVTRTISVGRGGASRGAVEQRRSPPAKLAKSVQPPEASNHVPWPTSRQSGVSQCSKLFRCAAHGRVPHRSKSGHRCRAPGPRVDRSGDAQAALNRRLLARRSQVRCPLQPAQHAPTGRGEAAVAKEHAVRAEGECGSLRGRL
eukprot:7233751-Prymnesium_polylepis.2